MIDQNFTYTCTGTEANGGTDFLVPLPAPRFGASYYVSGYVSSAGRVLGVDFPALGRTASRIQVVTTAPVGAGDTIELHVYDPRQHVSVPMAAPAFQFEVGGAATLADGLWRFRAGTSTTVSAALPVAVGCRLLAISLTYTRGRPQDATGTISATTARRSISFAGNITKSTVPGASLTIGSGFGWQVATTPTLNHIVRANSFYYVRVTMDSVPQAFAGVIVQYDLP